ncbi:hypothetical protein BC936DRAFT_142856 [Jimgerdemannia flammicorona]|uniref:Uncharacterized protein n=1 Tax=Jimgerdemannia flammicorona TaxID=994334 RepID=A0A433DER4_9FUNG|nr:hypothetical protein BC936DRAFT_142856 [Jimgerdemannia flammicorona]
MNRSTSTNLRAGSSSIPGANIHTFVPTDEDINVGDYEFDSASESDISFSKLKIDDPKMAPNLYGMLYLYKDNGVNGLGE